MLVPLIIGAVIRTFFPNFASYFGSFTNAFFTGVIPILAVWFFCMGASIQLKGTATVFRKSGTLVIVKVLVSFIVAKIAMAYIPEAGVTTGFFAGLSTLAIVSATNMTNGGLYAGIMQRYGTKEEAGAFVLMSIESGPLVTMAILGASGAATFQPHIFVGAVLPFILGYVLGNLDGRIRELFAPMSKSLIPFFGLALGSTINLAVIAQAGLLGVLLAVAVIIVTGIPLILADKFIGGGDGTAGIAASSSAGAAAANPLIIAGLAPQFAPVAATATTLVAACVIVTAILTPIVTAAYSKQVKRKKLHNVHA